MSKVGIDHVPVLKYGDFEDLMQLDTRMQSKVPEMYSLPVVEGNMMEGVVISPVDPYFFSSGERIIFKRVNEEFAEKKSAKEKFVPTEEMSEELKLAINEVVDFINETRLQHILSHHADLTEKDFGLILKELNVDVYNEFRDTTEISLSKADEKKLGKEINKLCSKLIKEVWLPTV